MDLDQLKQILELVREHELAEFEVEHEGLRLKIKKDVGGSLVAVPTPGASLPTVVLAPGMSAATASSAAATPSAGGAATPTTPGSAAGNEVDEMEVELAVVKSPIVGTFYRSAEPSAPPFVEVGSMVKKGQVLCIIEAMKLMSEIDSEYDGVIVNIYVDNGQPVQYGERRFAIKTR